MAEPGLESPESAPPEAATPPVDEAPDEWENETASTRSSTSGSTSCSDSDGSSTGGSGSEQEDLKDYKRGGYHPLKPRDFLNNRYLIIRKLGWGHFSTVWMAFDQSDGDFKALKVVRSASTYTETARDEIELLLHSAKADPEDHRKDRLVRYESLKSENIFWERKCAASSKINFNQDCCPRGNPGSEPPQITPQADKSLGRLKGPFTKDSWFHCWGLATLYDNFHW